MTGSSAPCSPEAREELERRGFDDPYDPAFIYRSVFGAGIRGHAQTWPDIDFDTLREINRDTVGWIHMDKTPLDYPVVKQHLDRGYYRTHNFSGEKSIHGQIVLDFWHGGSLDARTIVLHGHHMKDWSMFHVVTEMDGQAYFDAHPTVQFAHPGGIFTARWFAGAFYFHFGHSYLRKATELVIVLQAERKLGKDRILELYLNIIYYGNGVYGVGDAARFYFGKEPRDLSVNQMFMLAVLPVVPTKGNPIQHPEVFERFRNKRVALLSSPKHAVITPSEVEEILSRHADCLDSDLRKPDEFTNAYPQYAPLTNERFGPFPNEGYRNDSATRRSVLRKLG